MESISLSARTTEPGKYVPEIEVVLDGHRRTFMLDLGAATSSVATDDQTKSYPSLEKTSSKGVSGKPQECDLIEIGEIKIGERVFLRPRLQRADANILGVDLLKDLVFQVDLKSWAFRFLSELPKISKFAIRRLLPGHITVPIRLADTTVYGLFDTGADSTVIDQAYIANHSKHFQLLRSEEGRDAHGNVIPSEVFTCKAVEIEALRLSDVEMSAFEFGEFFRGKMEGSPIIIGNNIISAARWSFDLKSGLGTIEKY